MHRWIIAIARTCGILGMAAGLIGLLVGKPDDSMTIMGMLILVLANQAEEMEGK